MNARPQNRIACPKCQSRMERWNQSGFAIDRCRHCGGLWFDAQELTKHFAMLRSPSPEARLRETQTTTLACPRCDDAHLNDASMGEVDVERCPSCLGIFLDEGELGTLLQGSVAR